jgi:DNA primase
MINNSSVDYATLKQSVSMVQILERYGLMGILMKQGDSLSGACPIHQGHNVNQFRVNIAKNCWVCFGDCHRGGSILDWVSLKEGVSIKAAAVLIQEWFGLAPNGMNKSSQAINVAPARMEHSIDGMAVNSPLGFALSNLEPNHPYLKERGLEPATIKTFGIGYCRNGIMAGRIAIPVHNETGQLVAYAGRWAGITDVHQPKYRFPKGFRKSQELFNLHRSLTADSNLPWVIVEGFFGCIKLWQYGVRHVIALMGSVLSKAQEELIRKHLRPQAKVILMLDEDAAGRAGRTEIAHRLASSYQVQIHTFAKEGNQPDDLNPDQAIQAIS